MNGETKRIVEYMEGNSGIWDITCPACPLKVHTDALGQKPQACAHGIATNMQGPMMLGSCKHNKKNSLAVEGDKLTLLCEKVTL